MKDISFVESLIKAGFKEYFTVPCTITNTVHKIWEELSFGKKINLLTTTHEHNLAGLAAGAYFATGRPAVVLMQNSGLGNFADGLITFAQIFKIPMLIIVTWRGDSAKDESEPHQAIGKITDAFTHTLSKNVFGNQDGSNFESELKKAIKIVQKGESAILRVASSVLQKTLKNENDVKPQPKAKTMSLQKSHDAFTTREESLKSIIQNHKNAAILFANGYTAREAKALFHKPNHFYNIGYMGGTLAIGYALAWLKPELDVVVVDGDQNAQMSCAKDHLANFYPKNLHWYILDNQVGASVGNTQSLPLAPWYYDLATVLKFKPEKKEFSYPRVHAKNGNISSLAEEFQQWIKQKKSH